MAFRSVSQAAKILYCCSLLSSVAAEEAFEAKDQISLCALTECLYYNIFLLKTHVIMECLSLSLSFFLFFEHHESIEIGLEDSMEP